MRIWKFWVVILSTHFLDDLRTENAMSGIRTSQTSGTHPEALILTLLGDGSLPVLSSSQGNGLTHTPYH